MNDIITLRSCPFCGGTVDWHCAKCSMIVCPRCGHVDLAVDAIGLHVVTHGTLFDARRYCADRWNRRTAIDVH